MACRNWSVSRLVRFFAMLGLYRMLAIMSSSLPVPNRESKEPPTAGAVPPGGLPAMNRDVLPGR